jgi:hypothetical protein
MMPTLKGVARPPKTPYSGSFLIRHGQVRWVAKGDVVGQASLIERLFGIAA